MIIRLSLRRTLLPLAIGLLIAVPALVVLGRVFTPRDSAAYRESAPRILTWTDWQVRQARAAYAAELASLRRDARAEPRRAVARAIRRFR